MKKKSFIIISVLFIIIILLILNIYKCPIKYIFGLSCPLCGLTRAFFNVLQFNLKKAFYYHLFWPIILIFIIFHILYEFKIIKIKKKIIYISLYLFSILNIIYYFYRLIRGSDIVYFNFSESLIYRIFNFIKILTK